MTKIRPSYKKRLDIVELVMDEYKHGTLLPQEVDSIIIALYLEPISKVQDKARLANFMKVHEEELQRMEEEDS